MTGARLVLASASPQRRAILEQIGVRFEVVVPDIEESTEGKPGDLVVDNAMRKAEAVASSVAAGVFVIAADTLVVKDGRPLGKPRDIAEAERFLRCLSGDEHEVVSGVAVADRHGVEAFNEWTEVTFRELDGPTLHWYLDSGEWEGRAGGYAIQGKGAALVERIEGDYLNVVGLPLAKLLRLKPSLPLFHR